MDGCTHRQDPLIYGSCRNKKILSFSDLLSSIIFNDLLLAAKTLMRNVKRRARDVICAQVGGLTRERKTKIVNFFLILNQRKKIKTLYPDIRTAPTLKQTQRYKVNFRITEAKSSSYLSPLLSGSTRSNYISSTNYPRNYPNNQNLE